MITEKDISTMASNLSSRTQANEIMNFGTRRIKNIKAFTHYVQDLYRISALPSIVGLSAVTFKTQLDRSSTRADIRKSMANKTKIFVDAVSPVPLEKERKRKQWEETFVNYTRSHIGENGVPLSYVIRVIEEPDVNGEHPDYINKTLVCAPLEEGYCSSDLMYVFNMVVFFKIGQPSSEWIKTAMKQSDRRQSMEALHRHFAGEINATWDLA